MAKTTDGGFSAEERAAMKARAAELRAQATTTKAAELEAEVLAKFGEMPEEERAIGERLHALVREHAPELIAKTWYGMPAWVAGGVKGKVVLFFQSGTKFDTRYSTVGFSDQARLDDGTFWPVGYAITTITPEVEARLVALIQRATAG